MSSKPNPSSDTVPLNVQFTFTVHVQFYMFLCLLGRPDTESMPVAKALAFGKGVRFKYFTSSVWQFKSCPTKLSAGSLSRLPSCAIYYSKSPKILHISKMFAILWLFQEFHNVRHFCYVSITSLWPSMAPTNDRSCYEYFSVT
jgi:hypothetical protein